jgi:hypothetical protein
MATGEQGSATQYQEFNWKFAPWFIQKVNIQ